MARQRAAIVTAGSDLRGHSGTGVKKLLTCSLLPCRLAQPLPSKCGFVSLSVNTTISSSSPPAGWRGERGWGSVTVSPTGASDPVDQVDDVEACLGVHPRQLQRHHPVRACRRARRVGVRRGQWDSGTVMGQ